ncbi:hypothetical protein [Halonotius roseus]|uniref:CARDB domain-containing protein n=1 Tax=Halonotius roseus TaxID=2511997 RepID=A0A544QSB7_9EURY|nr:hypothetical protein [Halonotius roseus]TQQ82340.1 hypothetical protein EWF95_05295 [Halonotius roseus]
MKRRNFILGGGLLATLSLGTTATNASLADAVSTAADFRVLAEKEINAKLEAVDTTEFETTTHTWDGMPFTSDGQTIVEIQADYNFNGSGGFDTVDEGATIIEFYSDRGDRRREATFNLQNVNGATATFQITGGQEVIVDSNGSTNVSIDIVNFENPETGNYSAELTFIRDDGENLTVTDTLSTAGGVGQFNVTIIDSPSEITIGNTIPIEAEIENTGADGGQVIDLIVDGSGQDNKQVTLTNDQTKTVNLESNSIDQGGDVSIDVQSENDTASTTVSVIGGWSLDLAPATAGDKNSTHTWSTPGFTFNGEVSEVFFDYSGQSRGFRLGGLTANDVTVEMEVGDDDSLTTIGVDSVTSQNKETATVVLDPNADTTVGGEMNIVLNGVENINKSGEYSTDIELRGDDTFSESVTTVVE